MTLPIVRQPLPEGFLARVGAIFGDRLHRGEAILRQHGTTESHIETVLPDAVVFPRTSEEVVELVHLCRDHGVPIIPFGAGTSLEGHISPVHGGITLDMSEMNAILEVNAGDLDCTVQPGVRREQLNAHVRDLGLFFPVDPGANATLGGMAATRASGTNAVLYGTMREQVLALRVVTADGRDIRTSRRSRKSAAGYDLTALMVGSEGTLGIFTEITLRLYGIPETISAAVCSFASIAGAVDTVAQLIQLGVRIARVELLDDVQMRASNAWSKLDYPELTTLFFEFQGSPAQVREQIDTVAELAAANGGGDFTWAEQAEDRSRLWKARHQAYYAALGLRPGSVGWPTDVCVPISRLAECISETKRDLEKASMPAPIVGHVGDGNFHVVFVLDPDNPAELAEAEALNHRLVERALAMDGTCTGEHGIGIGKQDWLRVELGEAVDVMAAIKRTLDPANILNPGKIFIAQV